MRGSSVPATRATGRTTRDRSSRARPASAHCRGSGAKPTGDLLAESDPAPTARSQAHAARGKARASTLAGAWPDPTPPGRPHARDRPRTAATVDLPRNRGVRPPERATDSTSRFTTGDPTRDLLTLRDDRHRSRRRRSRGRIPPPRCKYLLTVRFGTPRRRPISASLTPSGPQHPDRILHSLSQIVTPRHPNTSPRSSANR